MALELIFWLVAFIINIALFASNLYQFTCLADLEDDYLNPFETSSRVNRVIMPEYYLQGFYSAYVLFTGHWFMFLLAVPLTCYHAKLFLKQKHLLDVTEVFRNIKFEKYLRMVKMGFYLISFFLITIRLVLAIFNTVAGEENAVHLF